MDWKDKQRARSIRRLVRREEAKARQINDITSLLQTLITQHIQQEALIGEQPIVTMH